MGISSETTPATSADPADAPNAAPATDAPTGEPAAVPAAPAQPGVSATVAARAALPEHVREEIQRRRMVAQSTQEIASLSWGREMDPVARAAIGSWCAENYVDPQQEIDVLGGRIYLNARFYMNRAQPLIAAGYIVGWHIDNVSPDPRLLEMAERRPDADTLPAVARAVLENAEWAALEDMRRERARIDFKVPDDAEVVYVARIHVRGMSDPFTGCKWWVPNQTMTIKKSGGGTYEKQKDPVSDSGFGVESVETRAIRRALRLVVGKLPATDPTRRSIEAAEEGAKNLGEILMHVRARVLIDEEAAVRDHYRKRPLAAGVDGAYGDLAPARELPALGAGATTIHGQYDAPAREAVAARPVSAAAARSLLTERDPMTGEPDTLSPAAMARMGIAPTPETVGPTAADLMPPADTARRDVADMLPPKAAPKASKATPAPAPAAAADEPRSPLEDDDEDDPSTLFDGRR